MKYITKLKKNESMLAFLISASCILSLGPYFIWSNPHLVKAFVMMTALFTLRHITKTKLSLVNLSVVFLYFILLLYLSFPLSQSGLMFNSLTIILACFFIVNNNIKYQAGEMFYKFFSILLIPGIVYWLINFLGIDLPWNYLDSEHQGKVESGYFYKQYIGSIVLTNDATSPSFGSVYRLSSLYDEPGVVGTLAALFLIIKKLDFKDYYSKVLLIAGILSFSLAFYILLILHALFIKPLKTVFALLIASIILFSFEGYLSQYNTINNYIYKRLALISQGVDKIDNRSSSCFDEHYATYIESNKLLTGMGHNSSSHNVIGCGQSHIKQIVYEYGLLGAFAILLFFTYILFVYKDRLTKDNLYLYTVLMLILVLSLYQRPSFNSLWFIVIFVSGIFNIKNTTLDSTLTSNHENTTTRRI